MVNIDILSIQPPTEHLERIELFAKALAHGAVNNQWAPRIRVNRFKKRRSHRFSPTDVAGEYMGKTVEHEDDEKWLSEGYWTYEHNLTRYIHDIWEDKPPQVAFLEAFGYVQQQEDGDIFLLTPLAFDLLKSPPLDRRVFISYRRDVSTAFALLVEARLRIAGNANVFIDKQLKPGDLWHAQLEEQIRNSYYFVCLVGKTTLKSDYVMQEINWADRYGCTIISIWHGCKISDSAPEALKTRQVIPVDGKSADHYEQAVNKLLNRLGYPTY